MKRLVIFALAALTTSSVRAEPAGTRVVSIPGPSMVTTVSVGSTAWVHANQVTVAGARLPIAINVPVGTSNDAFVRAAAGDGFAFETTAKGTLKACSMGRPILFYKQFQDAGCLVDGKKNGQFDSVRFANGGRANLATPVAYQMDDVAIGGTRQELIYSGLDGHTLRLSYREFVNDLARPAFTQDVTFTLSGKYPETVAFRDVKLTILGIDNSGLRYRIEP